MVKHNNVVPNGHFRYNWQKLVKTWFNQPARKVRRRLARDEKKTAFAPRPLKSLRPLVQGQTLKYSAKEKQGRGFTLFEIKQAGLTAAFARSIGVTVDHRRKNRSAETLQKNVHRLEVYKSKLTLYPLKPNKPKKGQINDAVVQA